MKVDIARVVQVFEEAGARWTLVGAHAVGLVTEPRATADFDFIVEDRKLRQILAGLGVAFGELDAEDIGAAIRVRALDVDLIRAVHPLFKEALARSHKVGDWNVPATEVLIVLKFLAAVSPWRGPEKRTYDVGDLRSMYRAVGRDALDVGLMMQLAALVYPRAEQDFAVLLERMDRGDPIEI